MNTTKTFATLRPLIAGQTRKAKSAKMTDEAITESFHTLAERLENSRENATYHFQISEGKRVKNYCLNFRNGSVEVENKYAKKHDFGLRTEKEVWQDMASGNLSPLDAFLQGKLLLTGDENQGFRMFFRLADDNGQKTIV